MDPRTAPRATLAIDPFVSNATAPSTFDPPSVPSRAGSPSGSLSSPAPSFFESRQQRKALSARPPPPAPASLVFASPPSSSPHHAPAKTVPSHVSSNAYVPLSPETPGTPRILLSGAPSLGPDAGDDTHMADVFATPPAAARSVPSMKTLCLSPPSSTRTLRQPLQYTKAAASEPPSRLVLNVAAPLTPPLTPPYTSLNPPSLPRQPFASTSSSSSSSSSTTSSTTPSSSYSSSDFSSCPPSPRLELLTPPLFSTPAPFPPCGRLAHYPLHPLFQCQYTLHEELGSGGFGFVVRATRLVDGASVAVKFIERAKIPAHGWVLSRSWGEAEGLREREDGKRVVPMEAYVLRSARHEGVVAFIDLFEDDTYFYLVMEHHGAPWSSTDKTSGDPASLTCPSDLPSLALPLALLPLHPSNAPSNAPLSSPLLAPVLSPTLSPVSPPTPTPAASLKPVPVPMVRRSSCDLFECIEQHTRFSEQTAKYVFAQIVEVVWALGQQGICHRDLKDENIVVGADYKVKLIDFGSAVIFDPRAPPPVYTRFYGTTAFASSEILLGKGYTAPASEVWSLGVLLSILLTGECPFADAAAASVGRISKSRVRIGQDVTALVRSCLEVDVERRITVGELRRHPWLRGAFDGR